MAIWRVALLMMAAETASDSSLVSFVASGRIVGLAETPSERLQSPVLAAPGAPPVLSFRYFDAADRGRYANLGLMTDDAGH